MLRDRFQNPCSIWTYAAFDPATLMVSSMAATAAGSGVSAMGQLASGDYAAQAGQMQRQVANSQADEQDAEAKQLDQNAVGELASAQRVALDRRDQTRMAISTAMARGAQSGVDIGSGSPLQVMGQIAKRGEYHALMDMFNGENAMVGDQNKANFVRHGADLTRIGGAMQEQAGYNAQSASQYQAFGTLASGAGSAMKTYGAFNYPTAKGASNFG